MKNLALKGGVLNPIKISGRAGEIFDNKDKILLHLACHPDSSFTLHQLSGILSIPYASFHRTIEKMGQLITKKKAGKAFLLTLNKHPVLPSYLAVASQEKKEEFLKSQPLIKIIANDLKTDDIVLLFGSYAKKKENERSDIDILVINPSGKKTLSFRKYEVIHNKAINPVFITNEELKAMLASNEENVGKHARNHHVILNNPQRFWETAL